MHGVTLGWTIGTVLHEFLLVEPKRPAKGHMQLWVMAPMKTF
jgi:hypothetical protein